MITLVLADDHPVVRDGLRAVLDADPRFEVLAEAADGAEAVAAGVSLRPDVILMDLRMPGTDGVSAIEELADRGVQSRVLVLTTFDADTDVLPAIEAGATGYLLKDTRREDLFAAVVAAAEGRSVLSPAVATRVLERMRRPQGEELSSREVEVLDLIARGHSNRAAARALFISEATVKTHLLHVYAKLGVRDRAAAVATAMSRGLLPSRPASPPAGRPGPPPG